MHRQACIDTNTETHTHMNDDFLILNLFSPMYT